MLTNLFSKSRPIGYIAIGLLLLVVYFLQLISDLSWLQSPTAVIEKIILFFAVVFSVLLIQFITVKNNLAVNNLYSLFFYACFLIIFPTYFDDSELIIANLLIDRKSTRLNSSHVRISYAVFCLKKKNI